MKDATKGAQQVARIDGAGGVVVGLMAAPFARQTITGLAPSTFEGDTARTALLGGQAIVGGMMAAGRMGRGGAVRYVGMGVAAEAARTLLEQFIPQLGA